MHARDLLTSTGAASRGFIARSFCFAGACLLFVAIACGPSTRDRTSCKTDDDCRRGELCDGRACAPQDTDGGCVPKSCADLNARCGQVSDGCGGTVSCGGCPEGKSCGATGQCEGCVDDETDQAFCARLGKNCGLVTGQDETCGSSRTVECGACFGAETCGGRGVPNVCAVPPGGGDPCVSRYDCPSGLICLSSECVEPAADNVCNQDVECPRGFICNFSRQCEDGCVDARDCDSPKLCHPKNFTCEVCSFANPCGAGLACVEGECRTALACTVTQDCVNGGVDGAVCRDGFCSNCESHLDCLVDPYQADRRSCGLDGLCKKVVCDDDTCRSQLGNLAYCNTGTNECATRECLSDSDCVPGTVCNLADYTCINPNCATDTCKTECASRGMRCHVAACRCSGSPGAEGDPCVASSECEADYVCAMGKCTEAVVTSSGAPCDANTCIMEGCFGAHTQRPCDPMGCYVALMYGTPIGCL